MQTYDRQAEEVKIRKACSEPEYDAMKIYRVLRTLPLLLRDDLQCLLDENAIDEPLRTVERVCREPEYDSVKILYVLRTMPEPLRKDLQCIIKVTPLNKPLEDMFSKRE